MIVIDVLRNASHLIYENWFRIDPVCTVCYCRKLYIFYMSFHLIVFFLLGPLVVEQVFRERIYTFLLFFTLGESICWHN